MKYSNIKKDILFLIVLFIIFIPFFISSWVFDFYLMMNKEHALLLSGLKFGILATLGEMIGMRIKKGFYIDREFGLIAKFFYWAIIGITIKYAFIIFTGGTLAFYNFMGVVNVENIFKGGLSFNKVLLSFSISLSMNVIYAPVMMIFHRLTDLHIILHKGSPSCIFKPIMISKLIKEINWDTQWNFVIKKTIPLIWVPAHTITFLLPDEYQILFAAFLSIILGVILAIASLISKNK